MKISQASPPQGKTIRKKAKNKESRYEITEKVRKFEGTDTE